MSTNPVYALFATPKSFGPLILRLLLAAVFILHGGEKAFGWFGGAGWSATVLEWNNPEGLHLPVWISALVISLEIVAAAAFFLGFFTRLFALAIMVEMAGAIWFVHAAQGLSACEYPAALLAVALSLVFLGGGRLSLDRGISGQLLPAIG